jgi:predicted RNase H-like HicB family nuclease
MKTYSFKVVVEPDEDAQGNPAWHAYCPALESVGGATSGKTRDEALSNINEVVRMIVQEFIDEGKPLPEGPGEELIATALERDGFSFVRQTGFHQWYRELVELYERQRGARTPACRVHTVENTPLRDGSG